MTEMILKLHLAQVIFNRYFTSFNSNHFIDMNDVDNARDGTSYDLPMTLLRAGWSGSALSAALSLMFLSSKAI